MGLTKTVTAFEATDAGVWTITVGDTAGLAAGATLTLRGMPSAIYNVTITVTAVDTTLLTVTGTVAAWTTLVTATDAEGYAAATVTWIDTAYVAVLLAYTPTGGDATYLTAVTLAANEWAYTRRSAAGYTSDVVTTTPNGSVKLGTGLYAVALYRERGSVDSFASFTDTPVTGTFGSMGQINRLLGVNRSQVA